MNKELSETKETMLSIKIDSFSYGDKPILVDTKIDFKDYGIYVIRGENGAGKSTFLSLLSGKTKLKNGSLFYQGLELSQNQISVFSDNNVTYVPQDPLIFDDETVLKNVLLPFTDKDEKRALDILGELGLSDSAKQNASSLSGGEKQRLSLARVLYQAHSVILLDEITSNLDPVNTGFILKAIQKLSETHIVVFVTHEVLPDEFIKNSFVFLIENKKINEVKKGVSHKFIKESKPIEKEGFKQMLKDSFFSQKVFYRCIMIFFSLLSALAVFFGSFDQSFSKSWETDSHYSKVLYESYLNDANGYLIDTDYNTLPDFEENTVFYVGNIQADYLIDSFSLTSSQKGSINPSYSSSVLSGVAYIAQDGAFKDYGFELVKGAYPSKKSELMLSDICFKTLMSCLSSSQGISESQAEAKILSGAYVYSDLGSSYTITGAYKAWDYDEFESRMKTDASYLETTPSYEFRMAYSLGVQTCFSLYDSSAVTSFALIKNTNVNKKLMTKSLAVNSYIFGFVSEKSDSFPFNPIILRKNGQAAFSQEIKNASLYSLAFIVSSVALLILAAVIVVGFTMANNRPFILMRYSSVSRKKLTKGQLLPLMFTGFCSILVGCLMGGAGIMVSEAVFKSKMYSASVFLMAFPYKALICLMGIFVLFSVSMYVILYHFITPEDFSKKIVEIKDK